jgi:hypothetical protein
VRIGFYFETHGFDNWPYGWATDVAAGWYIDQVEIVAGALPQLPAGGLDTFEDMGAPERWTASAGIWEVGVPASGPVANAQGNRAHEGTNCLATILSGNYTDDRTSRVMSPTFVVPGAEQNPRLRFWHWWNIAGHDLGKVQVSADNGATWTDLSLPYTADSSGQWTQATLDLSAYAGKSVRIGFYFETHGFDNWPYGWATDVAAGWYIDQVLVEPFVAGPAFLTQPANQTVISGQTASFTAEASGSPAPSYHWQVSTDGVSWSDLTDTGVYSGSHTPALTIKPATAAVNGYRFCCVAIDSTGANAVSLAATLTVNPAAASVALTNLTQVYDGTGKPATVTTSPSGLAVAVTYNGSTAVPVTAGEYAVLATITAPDYKGSATGTLTISKATPAVTWAKPATMTYGTPLTVAQLNATANVSGVFAYTPVSGTILGVGVDQVLSVVFTPTDAANYRTASATTKVTVEKAAAAIVLGGLSAKYDGTPKSVTATTSPVGLTVNITYGGTNIAPTNAGSYPVVATVNDASFSGTVTGMLVIAQATPVLTWEKPSEIAYGAALSPAQLNAKANVAGAYTYSPASGTVLGVGRDHALVVTFTPTDSVNYRTATATNNITVLPAIAKQPSDTEALIGSTVELSVGVNSDVPVTYRWYRDGVALVDNDRIAGSATAALKIGAAGLSDSGSYQVVVTAGDLAVTSDEAVLAVAPLVPDRVDITLQQGQSGRVTVPLSNLGSVPVQLQLEVVNPVAGLTATLEGDASVVIPARGSLNKAVLVSVGSLAPGVYDRLLLKVTDFGGHVHFTTIVVTVVAQPLPNLSVRADGIVLQNYTVGGVATVTARVENRGTATASGVRVRFLQFGATLSEVNLGEIPAGGAAMASVDIPTPTAGERLVQVVVDPDNTIQESDETDNAASKVFEIGTPPAITGGILVTGSVSSLVYVGDVFTVNGAAVYDLFVDGVRYTDYPVKGAKADVTIVDASGEKSDYRGLHTTIEGRFARSIQAPAKPGFYTLLIEVTDETLSGELALTFEVRVRPALPPMPPLPPGYAGGPWFGGGWSDGPSGGSEPRNYWVPLPGAGGFVWNPPVPMPWQSDLWVFSEDIHFSIANPRPGESLWIFTGIHYWATNTNLIARDVPVNFYATWPGATRIKIGETKIGSISVGAPDFGSQFVFSNWRALQKGIYIIETEIAPSYVEAYMLNNAATRAIIVGDLGLGMGAVAGQVRDFRRGVVGVDVSLWNAAGTQLIDHRRTDSRGYYLFESVASGNYQVSISVPRIYVTDKNSKPATVQERAVTTVDFYVKVPGDLDHDGDVDQDDRNIWRAALGAREGDSRFNPEADYDQDHVITNYDYTIWYNYYKAYLINSKG